MYLAESSEILEVEVVGKIIRDALCFTGNSQSLVVNVDVQILLLESGKLGVNDDLFGRLHHVKLRCASEDLVGAECPQLLPKAKRVKNREPLISSGDSGDLRLHPVAASTTMVMVMAVAAVIDRGHDLVVRSGCHRMLRLTRNRSLRLLPAVLALPIVELLLLSTNTTLLGVLESLGVLGRFPHLTRKEHLHGKLVQRIGEDRGRLRIHVGVAVHASTKVSGLEEGGVVEVSHVFAVVVFFFFLEF